MGQKTSRTFAKTLGFLDQVEKKMDVRGGGADNSGH